MSDQSPYSFLGESLSNTQKAEELRHVPLLRGLSEDYRMALARHGQDTQAQPGDVLVREGETGRELMLILDGTVRVERNGQTITKLGPGNYFGEIAMLDGQPRSADVVADTRVRLLVVGRPVFDELIRAHPELTQAIILELCSRLRSKAGDEII